VLTSLENVDNLEISGKFVTRENSGNLKCTQGMLLVSFHFNVKMELCVGGKLLWKY